MREEHGPQGPTEEQLVEELAGIIWRKRRLRLAEAATHRGGLRRTMSRDQSDEWKTKRSRTKDIEKQMVVKERVAIAQKKR